MAMVSRDPLDPYSMPKSSIFNKMINPNFYDFGPTPVCDGTSIAVRAVSLSRPTFLAR